MVCLYSVMLYGIIPVFAAGISTSNAAISPGDGPVDVTDLTQEPTTPPDTWQFLYQPAPSPRQTFRLKDILLTSIAGLTMISLRPYNAPAISVIITEPDFPSDVQIVLQVEGGNRSKYAGFIWALWYIITYYLDHSRDTGEVSFSAIYRGFNTINGGVLDKDREIHEIVRYTSTTFSTILPHTIPRTSPELQPTRNVSNYTVSERVDLGETPLHHIRCGPIIDGVLLNPASVYATLAAYIYHVAPRPNDQKLIDERIFGPVGIPHESAFRAEAVKRDARGRPLFTQQSAKRMPRLIARFMTAGPHGPNFHEFQCDVLDQEARDTLAVFAVVTRGGQGIVETS